MFYLKFLLCEDITLYLSYSENLVQLEFIQKKSYLHVSLMVYLGINNSVIKLILNLAT